MRLERTRRQIRFVMKGLATLVAIYRRDRHLSRLLATVWFVATREGLIGVRHWLIRSAPPDTLAIEAARSEADAASPPAPAVVRSRLGYQQWLERFDPLQERDLAAAQHHLATLDLPELLILAVLPQHSLACLDQMVASWQSSIHHRWRAVIVPAAGLTAADEGRIRASIAGDPRIEVVADVEAIPPLCLRFSYVLLSFGGTLLNSLSLYMFLESALRTGSDIVYSDHDLIDAAGERAAPAFKPQFSPEYLARYNYIGTCMLLSRSVPLSLDAARLLPHLDLAGYDRLAARLALYRRVEHLPFTLFHVMGAEAHQPHDLPSFADTGPGVAIIIPTRDGLAHLRPCIESIVERTSYDLSLVDIIVIDNNSVEPATLGYFNELAARPNITLVKYPGSFNFAEINNVGARATTRDILVLLNNDTLVHDPAWLSKLVAYAKQPGVGMVGGKLIFPDGTIQHGGCVAGGSRGTVQHLLSHTRPEDVAATDHTREMSLVTGACVAVKRDVFNQIGGFDPVLKVTWNDTKFCLQCLCTGLRNIYVADPLLIHDESKTRGHDNTRERYIRYFSEANYTRRRFREYFYDDPSYNPNLSLEQAGELAEPPRVRRPWARLANRDLRILVLSAVYKKGFGVPLVIQQHAKALTAAGYDVIIGGPLGENEFHFPGCERVELGSVKEAAVYAFSGGVSLIICHTPPFFALPILVGGHIPVLAYDYGEPPAEVFADPVRSYLLEVGYQKREAAALTTTIATISKAVKDEALNRDAIVVGLANSHLPAWSEASRPQRDRFRLEHGWNEGFVVLTVCRFHENERAYKGLDKIAAILREFPYLYPEQSKPLIWVLAGAGTPEDVEQAEQLGFAVFPNVSDDMLADLYRAADAYMGFSKWEGYNLGISQALAMGLPVLASDIPAHREFPITTTGSSLEACEWLARELERRTADAPGRSATVYHWEHSTAAFLTVVADMLQQSAKQKPRAGASGRIWQDIAA